MNPVSSAAFNSYQQPAASPAKTRQSTATTSSTQSADRVEISAEAKVKVQSGSSANVDASAEVTFTGGAMRPMGGGKLEHLALLLPPEGSDSKKYSDAEMKAFGEHNMKELAFSKWVNGLGITMKSPTVLTGTKLGDPMPEKTPLQYSCEKFGSFQTDDLIGFLRQRYQQ